MTRHVTHAVDCDRCEGSGIVNDDDGFPVACGTCLGSGSLYVSDAQGTSLRFQNATLPSGEMSEVAASHAAARNDPVLPRGTAGNAGRSNGEKARGALRSGGAGPR
jgi:hypothetical protein